MCARSITVNWHLTERCNYRCKFCFAIYDSDLTELCHDVEASKLLLSEIYTYFSEFFDRIKISFVGGEPFICKYLGHYVKFAKKLGFVVSIITNGSLITEDWLKTYGRYVDWIGISIDSANEETEKILGRGYGNHVANTIRVVDMIRRVAPNIKIKINTVITKLNYREDMTKLIKRLKPDRWKVFQFVPHKELPEQIRKWLSITKEEFNLFVKRHKHLNPIAETIDDTRDSYIMIDPYGRFYYRTNSEEYRYSEPILNVGVAKAFSQVVFDYKKFLLRGGDYI